MADDRAYRELKAKYDALQRRVTRFSAVEQKLINTGHRLDRELSRFGIIYGYSQQLIRLDELDAFAEVAAEAVVDVFEVEIGALWLMNDDHRLAELPTGMAGADRTDFNWAGVRGWLLAEGPGTANAPGADLVTYDEAGVDTPVGVSRLVACALRHPDGEVYGVVLGMVTESARQFYETPTAEYTGSFTVFVQLVGTLLQNREDQEVIQNQLEALRRSEIDLMQARDDAEAASRAKSNFLAVMSHEIRTPMNGVLGMTELLMDSGRLHSRQRRLARMAHRSAQSLLDVIEDILDFSKIEAGRMQLEEDDFDLRLLLDDCLELVSEQARRKRLQLIADYSPGLQRQVCGDPVRLRQILVNLLGNAVKFTDQGSVRLGAMVTQREDGLHLQLEIEDTGAGVDPQQHRNIFNAFEQADLSTARRHGGTGLGLAITRQLVNLMGGEIQFNSKPGKGSCFRVRLVLQPAVQIPPMATEDPPDNSDAAFGTVADAPLVLLVEDNAVNQEVALSMLETLGCRIEVAEDGREALELVADNEYALVLMDCHMPEMDGFKAAAETRILEREFGREPVPIIALTADVQKGIEERCRASGMDGYLSKPFQMARLKEALEQWLTLPVDMALKTGPLDRDVLDQLRDLGRNSESSLLNKLYRVFRDQAPALLSVARSALEHHDFEAVRQAAHSIKSSSANLGATAFSAFAGRLEQAALEASHDKAADTLLEMETTLPALINALKREAGRD